MQEESTLNSSQAPSTQVAVEQTELKLEFQRDAIRLKISKRPTPLINLKPPGSTGGLTAHTLTADGRFSMKSQELRVLQPPLPQNSEIFNRKLPVAPAAPESLPEDDYIIIQQSYVPDCSTRLEKSIHQRLDKLGIFAVDVKNSLEQYFKPPVIGKSALQLELAKKQQSRLTAKSTVNVTDVASVVQSLSGNKPTLNTGLSGLAARRNLLKQQDVLPSSNLKVITQGSSRSLLLPNGKPSFQVNASARNLLLNNNQDATQAKPLANGQGSTVLFKIPESEQISQITDAKLARYHKHQLLLQRAKIAHLNQEAQPIKVTLVESQDVSLSIQDAGREEKGFDAHYLLNQKMAEEVELIDGQDIETSVSACSSQQSSGDVISIQ